MSIEGLPVPKVVDASPDGDTIVEHFDSPIRSFFDYDIQRQIDEAVATLKENEHGAVIPYFKTVGSDYVARLAVVAKLSDGWSVVAAFEKRAGQPIGFEAAVKFTW